MTRQRVDYPRNEGLECRDCGCRDFHVLETRRTDGAILRRRECRHCGRRVTTRETTIGNS